MAFHSKGSARSDRIAISPVLLAAMLALLWMALFSDDGGDGTAPDWGLPIVIGTRFLAAFVVGWVAISLMQVVLRLTWLAASRAYGWSRR